MEKQGYRKLCFFLTYLTLLVSCLIAYTPIRHNDFVAYDDNLYVTKNSNVQAGITHDSFIWAFTNSYSSNWHPITWLSHMLDCEIYGLNPLGHHITSLLIHIANSFLLFSLLSKMTGTVWRSGFVAAAFALHPIHVESVAWVAERKDMLSGLFWMLTILAYARYAERPNIRRYVLVLLAFVMGLMSKPMVVTLPFVLLLLDYWPLGRLIRRQNDHTNDIKQQKSTSATYQNASIWYLLAEKVPLFILSTIFSIITYLSQKQGGAVKGLDVWPLTFRIVNSLGSYFNYIAKMLYPKGLAVLYPVPAKMTVDFAALAVMGVVLLLVLWGRGRRWLVVGLLWYLGTLVPVIGLVQVGSQMMADRYTYLPSIGIFIIIAWGAEEILSKMRYSKAILSLGASAALIAMILMTWLQVSYWRDTPTLFNQALAVTENNFVICANYGTFFCQQGQYEEGIRYLKKVVHIFPNYIEANENLCTALLKQKKFDEAIIYLTKALQTRNDWPEIHKMYYNLGVSHEQKGNRTQAETNYRKALELKPDYQLARDNLTRLLAEQGGTP